MRSIEHYQVAAECARRHVAPSTFPPTGDLACHELKVLSQNGEDGVIAEIMRRIGPGPRWFVEIGAHATESNCLFLATVLGWSGRFVDADPWQAHWLRHRFMWMNHVQVVETMVSPASVDALLRDAGVPEEIDLLSIDIDSHDFWVWRAVTATRPRVVVIEYNAAADPASPITIPLEHTEPWDGTTYQGASIGALRLLGRHKGYDLVHTDTVGVNAFFVRRDLMGAFRDIDPDRVPIRSLTFFNDVSGHQYEPPGRPWVDVRSLFE